MKDISVQLYEDNAGLREMISMLIDSTSGFMLKGAFDTATNAFENYKEYLPDVMLFDIDMPGANGIDGVKSIRKNNIDVNIIMWTVFDTDDYLFDALRAGANGYLLKGTPPKEILEAITEVMNGGAPMSPVIARRVLQSFNIVNSPSQVNLSPREKIILTELVSGKSYKMIAASLNISFQTVKTHIKNVYDKLHVHSQSEAVAKAIKERLV